MDSKRILVQFVQLLQRYRIDGRWASDAISAAVDAHEPSEAYGDVSDNGLQSLIDQAYAIGDGGRWGSLCEIAYDRMSTDELHVGNVATKVMMTLFQLDDSGRSNFIPPDADDLAEIAGAAFDLVVMTAARSNRG